MGEINKSRWRMQFNVASIWVVGIDEGPGVAAGGSDFPWGSSNLFVTWRCNSGHSKLEVLYNWVDWALWSEASFLCRPWLMKGTYITPVISLKGITHSAKPRSRVRAPGNQRQETYWEPTAQAACLLSHFRVPKKNPWTRKNNVFKDCRVLLGSTDPHLESDLCLPITWHSATEKSESLRGLHEFPGGPLVMTVGGWVGSWHGRWWLKQQQWQFSEWSLSWSRTCLEGAVTWTTSCV